MFGFLKEWFRNDTRCCDNKESKSVAVAVPGKSNQQLQLSSVERSLLKYLSGKEVSFVPAQYWYYEYGLNCEEEIKKFISLDFLEITKRGINSLTISSLKTVLKSKGIATTGNKDILIGRILESFNEDELEALIPLPKKRYALTVRGKAATEFVVPSVTKDIGLEDECLKFIQHKDFDSAFRRIACFRASAPGKFGIGIDWGQKAREGLDDDELYFYKDILSGCSEPDCIYREGMVLCDMLGAPGKLRTLMTRLLGAPTSVDGSAIRHADYAYATACSLREIRSYRDDDIKKYEILGAIDKDSCDTCRKMDGKRYYVSKAKIGVNFPPFCKHCRCTTVPVIYT